MDRFDGAGLSGRLVVRLGASVEARCARVLRESATLLGGRAPIDSPSRSQHVRIVTARRSDPAAQTPEEARRARVLTQVDPAKRVAAMLARWASEDVSDEPDWDVDDAKRVALRASSA
jgi:hypothetical protein